MWKARAVLLLNPKTTLVSIILDIYYKIDCLQYIFHLLAVAPVDAHVK